MSIVKEMFLGRDFVENKAAEGKGRRLLCAWQNLTGGICCFEKRATFYKKKPNKKSLALFPSSLFMNFRFLCSSSLFVFLSRLK